MDLKPTDTIQRILISSTARFVAEYEADGILITHAFPGLRNPDGMRGFDENPLSRNAYMINFTVPEVERMAEVVIPNYEYIGEWICSLVGLIYGKRFDLHGSIESHGNFYLPHLEQFSSLCIPNLPQNNHKPRLDIAIPLDLREIVKIKPMLMGGDADPVAGTALNAASGFYLRALQNAESDPEVAYLHLITAGEILANVHRADNEDLLDNDIRTILHEVRALLPNGEKAARMLTGRLRQIKRRLQWTVNDLMDDQFFPANRPLSFGQLRKSDNIAEKVGVAYDIRSRYLHTGRAFGGWIAPRRSLDELQVGKPITEDEKFSKLLQAAPTYLGLERIIRYCLIRFAERRGLFLKSAD